MTQTDALLGLETPSETVTFAPTRAAGLARLDQFISRAGKHYTSQRNYDFGPERRSNVSALSPWIRHRLITEEEVLKETLARHAPSTAEKFIQEVFWRTYFKGWLEQRPSVWTGYLEGLDKALMSLQKDRAMAVDYEDAIEGRSGIDGFDQWARELVETGYMHNHARMWFASIWVFTLKLPWELGADFFLRHLLDGDPASNTLGWRWIAGLHTKGKAYQARVSNISKYTEGRFRPEYQLATSVISLSETGEHARRPIPAADAEPDQDYLLLITEEDCRPETLFKSKPASVMGLIATQERSPLDVSPLVETFAQSAVQDAVKRMSATEDTSITSDNWAQTIIGKAEGENLKNVVTAYAPVGPVATQVAAVKPALEDAGITLHEVRRDYDDLAWPHATKGFFALKQKIPNVLEQLGLR